MENNYYKQYEPIFGEWYIKELIGEGSFGKVFKIEREDFGKTYKAALKVISIPESQSEINSAFADGMDEESASSYFYSCVEQVVEEFSLMSKLKGNSNIVSYENHKVIRQTGKIGWDILIQMELLTPINMYFKVNPIRQRDVIQLGIDLCKALEMCHKYNIIHRDIKPENIFISEMKSYKLGDFGIARTIEKTTNGLSKKGTYGYMAPEVYKGEAYGSSVDIYSLGIVLYRFLNNNRLPFLPPYPQQIKYTDQEFAFAKRMNGEKLEKPANAEGKLAEIVLKACAYNPADRYSSAVAMRKDLESILYAEEEIESIYCQKQDDVPVYQEALTKEELEETENKSHNTGYGQEDREKNLKLKLSKGMFIALGSGIIFCVIFFLIINKMIFRPGNKEEIITNHVQESVNSKEQDDLVTTANNTSDVNEYLDEENEVSLKENMTSGWHSIYTDEYIKPTEKGAITYYDIDGTHYTAEIVPDVPKTILTKDGFRISNNNHTYKDGLFSAKLGIDVSKYQKEIEWDKVKNDGIDFAIIRLGYRKYGEDPGIELDEYFLRNIAGAQSVGIDVGVYFYSQAITDKEAVEEADYVIQTLKENNLDLQLAVVYEEVIQSDGRTANLTGSQMTKNAVAFCNTIRGNGLEPMILSTLHMQTTLYEMDKLEEYPIFYADYEEYPQTPYAYDIWQFAANATVNGINGKVPMDLLFYRDFSGEKKTDSSKIPADILNGDYSSSRLEGEVTLGDFDEDFFLNFVGYLFENDSYVEPKHSLGKVALGGVGICEDSWANNIKNFDGNTLLEYNWTGNHVDYYLMGRFIAGEYSCCLYYYDVDLFSVSDFDLIKDGDPTTANYWVVFFTKGPNEPFYVKFFNALYYSKEEAMDSIL